MRRRRALTLVELLVAIAVIGVLVALLLPAVQAAREAARRVSCQSQVKQLALAALNEHDAHQIFPSGGWGWHWMGDADRGFSKDQPGGWVYNILPFIEQSALHQLPSDGDREAITSAQCAGAWRMANSPMLLLMCPSGREQTIHDKPWNGEFYANNCALGNGPALSARNDYAINSGDRNWNETPEFPLQTPGPLPGDHESATDFSWTWDSHGWPANSAYAESEAADEMPLTGVSFQRSEIAARHVTDGLSMTYLIGEKYLDPTDYESGADRSDNENWSTGWNNDNFRCAYDPPAFDRAGLPTKACQTTIFGSAHPAGWMMAWCDGHVALMSFDLDVMVHRASANRSDDGHPIASEPTCPFGAL